SAELTEDQLLLLLESLDKKIVPQQLKLVREHVSKGKKSLGAETGLLSFSQEEEGEITTAIFEMSGVTLRKDGSAVWTGEAFSAVAALYVSLYILHLLS
ncbi:GSDA3 protein, partial [Chloroceryle aenea]|nr:GSDA3 protein [Chloroceryle aenea]